MTTKYGIIISVENYSYCESISKVKYANHDAELIKSIFINFIQIPEENIYCYNNEQFTKEIFDEELQYYIKTMDTGSDLFFYYAGHGFFLDGTNYLTAFNTSLIDLCSTSVSFDVVLNTFKKSQVNRCIAFIDACAEIQNDNSRGINYRSFDLTNNELNLYKSSFGYSIFISCSPSEKSYSSDKFEHGIWTWYLIKAFRGDINACGNGPYISSNSLKDYLHDSLLEHKKKTDEIPTSQTPYAIVSSNSDEVLLALCEVKSIQLVQEMNDIENFSFVDECYRTKLDLFNRCSLACYDKGIIVDDGFDVNNFKNAYDACRQIESLGYYLPSDWENTFSKLRYYCNLIDEGNKLNLTFQDQIKSIEDVVLLIDNIPDGW